MPVLAHTDSVAFHSDGTATIGETQLKQGDYELKVEDNAKNLRITQDGKLIAQVPVHWIQLPKKSHDTEVDLTKNQVTEVEFAGSNEAVQVQSN